MGYRLDGDLRTALLGVGERLVAILGGLCLMLVLVALGLVVGWLARRAIIRLARAVDFDRHTERLGFAISLNRAGILRTPSDILALALAFGLGGRTLARDILARRLRRDAPPDRERLSHL